MPWGRINAMRKLTKMIICLLLFLLIYPSVFSNQLEWKELLSLDIKNTDNIERTNPIAFIVNTSGKYYPLQLVYVDFPYIYFVGAYEPGGQQSTVPSVVKKLDSLGVEDIKILADSTGCPHVAFIFNTISGKSLGYVKLSSETNQWLSFQELSGYSGINALFLCSDDQVRSIVDKGVFRGKDFYSYNFATGEKRNNINSETEGEICDVLSGEKCYYVSSFTKTHGKGKYKIGKRNVDWTAYKGFKPIEIELSFDANKDTSCFKFKLGKDDKIIPCVVWSNCKDKKIYDVVLGGSSNPESFAAVDIDNNMSLSVDVLWSSNSKDFGIPLIAYIDGKNTLKCAFKNPKDGKWQIDTVATGVERDSAPIVVYNNRAYIAYYCNKKIIISYADISQLMP